MQHINCNLKASRPCHLTQVRAEFSCYSTTRHFNVSKGFLLVSDELKRPQGPRGWFCFLQTFKKLRGALHWPTTLFQPHPAQPAAGKAQKCFSNCSSHAKHKFSSVRPVFYPLSRSIPAAPVRLRDIWQGEHSSFLPPLYSVPRWCRSTSC